MGPMLRNIINGNWSNLSAELRSHLKDRGVSKLAHSIKGLQVKETEKGWVMWSDEPLSFETNTPYAAGTDAAWGAGRQSSIGHTTMLLHAIDDFALDADSLDNMSREVAELMEQMRAEAEAEPPTQSAAAGNSGEAAAEHAADLTTANANASAATAAASIAAVQLAAMAAEAAAGAQGADASAAVAAQSAAPSTSAHAAVVAARANAAQIAGAPADAVDAAGDDGILPFRPRGGASRFGTTMRTDADVVRSASRGRARTPASQSAFSEHGLWQVETPGDGSCLYHATGHLLHGTEALAELECGDAIVAMVLREHVAARIEQSVSARSFVLQALEWRVHDTSQQGAMGRYNREDVRDTWMDDADVREMYSAAEAAYQTGEVEAFAVAEPAIMAAVATCVRNGAWGTELKCAELNEWLDMYDIELRCVSSESRVADVRSSRALVGLLYRQGAHYMSMATADNQTLFEPSRFALPAPVEAARPRIAGGSSSAQQRGDTQSAAMPQPMQEDRASSPSTSPSTRRGRSRHRGQGQGATAGARSFQIVCMRSYAGPSPSRGYQPAHDTLLHLIVHKRMSESMQPLAWQLALYFERHRLCR